MHKLNYANNQWHHVRGKNKRNEIEIMPKQRQARSFEALFRILTISLMHGTFIFVRRLQTSYNFLVYQLVCQFMCYDAIFIWIFGLI